MWGAPVGTATRLLWCGECIALEPEPAAQPVSREVADQTLNPFAPTEAEKGYCAAIFTGCMSRDITADLPWYSPDRVARSLQCPP